MSCNEQPAYEDNQQLSAHYWREHHVYRLHLLHQQLSTKRNGTRRALGCEACSALRDIYNSCEDAELAWRRNNESWLLVGFNQLIAQNTRSDTKRGLASVLSLSQTVQVTYVLSWDTFIQLHDANFLAEPLALTALGCMNCQGKCLVLYLHSSDPDVLVLRPSYRLQ